MYRYTVPLYITCAVGLHFCVGIMQVNPHNRQVWISCLCDFFLVLQSSISTPHQFSAISYSPPRKSVDFLLVPNVSSKSSKTSVKHQTDQQLLQLWNVYLLYLSTTSLQQIFLLSFLNVFQLPLYLVPPLPLPRDCQIMWSPHCLPQTYPQPNHQENAETDYCKNQCYLHPPQANIPSRIN